MFLALIRRWGLHTRTAVARLP